MNQSLLSFQKGDKLPSVLAVSSCKQSPNLFYMNLALHSVAFAARTFSQSGLRRLFLLLAGFLLYITPVTSQTVVTFNYTGAVQSYSVPAGVTSIIMEVWGGKGGTPVGGNGAYLKVNVPVAPLSTLDVYPGNQGNAIFFSGLCGGGGEASYVGVGGTPLIIAAGGGGGVDYGGTTFAGGAGNIGTNPINGSRSNVSFGWGAPGAGGNGGGAGAGAWGTGGGGGWSSAGANGGGTSGGAFRGKPSGPRDFAAGAGGGFNGGGGTDMDGGWGIAGGAGGGSFVTGTPITLTTGGNPGIGKIVFTIPCPTVGTLSLSTSGVCNGQSVTLNCTVGNADAGTSYYYSLDNGASYTFISTGATSPFPYIITPPVGSHNVRIKVTSSCTDIISNAVALTVSPIAIGGTATVNNATSCSGTNYTLTLTSASVGSTYQWEISNDGGATWANATGAGNNGTYSSSPQSYTTNQTPGTYQYRAKVTNGSCDVYSNPVSVTIKTAPTALTSITPNKTAVCSGDTVDYAYNLGTYNSLFTYEISFDNGGSWQTLGATGATGNVAHAYNVSATTVPTVIIRASNAPCTPQTISNSTVTVSPALTAGTTTVDSAIVCEGNNFTLTYSGSAGSIQWQQSVNGGATWSNSPSTITFSQPFVGGSTPSGAVIAAWNAFRASLVNTNTYTGFTIKSDLDPVGYTCTNPAIAQAMANAINTNTVTGYSGSSDGHTWYYKQFTNLTQGWFFEVDLQFNCIAPAAIRPEVGNQAWGGVNGSPSCINPSQTITLVFNVAGGGSTANPYTTTRTPGVYQFRAQIANGACNSYSNPVTVTVKDKFTAVPTVTTAATSVCSGSSVGYTATFTPYISGATYQVSQDNGVTWSALAVNTSPYNFNLTLNNTGTSSITSNVKVRCWNNPCDTVTSSVASVTVIPATVGGTAVATPASVCSGTAFSLNLTGSLATSIEWEESTNGGVSWNTSTGYTSFTQSVTKSPAVNTVYTYRARLSAGTCTYYSNPVTVNVSANFTAAPSLTVTSSTTVCTGTAVSYQAIWNPYISGALYEVSQDGGTTWSPLFVGSATTNFTLVANNSSTSNITKTVVVRCTNSPCSAPASASAAVTVYPNTTGGTVSITAAGGSPSCNTGNVASAAVTITLNNYVGSILQWERSSDGTNYTNLGFAGTNPINGVLQNFNTNGQPETKWFRALVQSGNCGNVYSAPMSVVVLPTPQAFIFGSPTICSGASAALTDSFSGNGATAQYRVFKGGSSVAGTGTLVYGPSTTNPATFLSNLSPTVTTTYWVEVQTAAQCDWVRSATGATITVNPDPVINFFSTASTSSICSGGSVSFNLSYSGTFPNSFFQVSKDNGATWTNITLGASVANFSLSFDNTTTSPINYNVRVRIVTPSCNTVADGPITITVAPPSNAGSATLTSSSPICSGGSATVVLSNYIGTISWERSDDGINYFAQGVSSSSITQTLTYPGGVYYYRAKVTNASCAPAYSNTATVIVRQPSPGIASFLASNSTNTITICDGASATFNYSFSNFIPVGAGPNGAMVSYEVSYDGGATWSTFSPAAASGTITHTFFNNLTATTAYGVIIRATNAPCSTNTSSTVTVTVNPAPGGGTTALTSGFNNVVCNDGNGGSGTSVTLSSNVGTIQDWEVSYNGGAWTSLGVSSNPLVVASGSMPNGTTSTVTYSFRARVNTSGPTCTNAYSTPITVTVQPTPTASLSTTANLTLCEGSIINLSSVVNGAISGARYRLVVNGVPGSWSNTVPSITALTPTNPSTSYILQVQNPDGNGGFCSTVSSNTITFTIYALPTGTFSGTTVCLGQTTVFTGAVSSSTFDYQYNFGDGVTSGAFANPVSGAANTTHTYGAAGTYPVTLTLRTNTVPSCTTVVSGTVNVIVKPTITISTANNPICAGSTTAIVPTAVGTGGSAEFEYTSNGFATWFTVAGVGTTAFSNLVSALSAIATSGTYQVRVRNSNIDPCGWQYSNIIIITVNGLPTASLTGSATVCAGVSPFTSSSFSATNTNSSTLYELSEDGGATWVSYGNNASNLQNALAAKTPTVNTNYVVRVTNPGCTPQTANFSVTIAPASVAGTAAASASSVCHLQTFTLSTTGSVGVVTWQEATSPSGIFTNVSSSVSKSNNTGVPVTYYYRANVVNGSCGAAISNVVSVTVQPQMAGALILPAATSGCVGSTINFTILMGTLVPTATYEYTIDGTTWTSYSYTSSPQTIAVTFANAGVYNAIKVRRTIGGCTETSGAAPTVTISATPVAGTLTLTSASAICNGSSTVISISGNSGNVDIQRSINGTSYSTIASGVTSSFTEALANTGGAVSPTNSPVYYYRAVISNAACPTPVYSNVVTQYVKESPNVPVLGGTATICSGNPYAVNVTTFGLISGALYEFSTDNGTTWTTYIPSSATHTLTLYFNNNTGSAVSYSIKVRVTNSPCSPVVSNTLSVSVNPSSAVGGTTTPSVGSICGSGSVTVTLSSYTGTILDWERADNATAFSSLGFNTASITQTLTVANTYYYRAKVSSGTGTCNTVYSSICTVYVAPVATASLTASSASVCAGSSVTLTPSFTGNVSGSVLEFSNNNGSTWNLLGSAAPFNVSPSVTTTYLVRITNSPCSPVVSTGLTVTVLPAATVGTLGISSTTYCAGSAAITLTLSASANGTRIWETSTDNGLTWNTISGSGLSNSVSPSATYPVVQYRVRVSGCNDVVSNTVTLNVLNDFATNPTMTSSSATTACAGSTITFTADYVTYIAAAQYQYSIDNGSTWTNVSPTAGNVNGFTFNVLFNTAGTYNVLLRAQNGTCGWHTSSPATVITVGPGSVAGTASLSTPSSICENGLVTISLAGYSGAIQWQRSFDGITWNNISGATLATLNQTPIGNPTVHYHAVVTNGVCASATSNEIVVNVSEDYANNPTCTPASQTVCNSTNVSFSVNWGGPGTITTGQYQYSLNNGSTWSTSYPIIGTSQTISIPFINSGTYQVLFRSQNGACAWHTQSAAVTVTVSGGAIAGTVSNTSSNNICLGSSVNLQVNGNIGTTTQWQSSTNNVTYTDISGATGNTTTQAPSSTGTWYYRVKVSAGSCPDAFSNVVVVNVTPVPSAPTISSAATVCAGSNGTLTAAGGTGTFIWEANSGSGWITVQNGGTTYNYTGISVTTQFRITATSGTCTPAVSASITITVTQASLSGTVSMTNASTICANATVTLNIVNQLGTIQWQNSTDGGLTWNNFGGGGTTQTATPNGSNPSVLYRAQVTNGTCAPANSNMVQVNVSADFTANPTLTPASTTICAGSAVSFVATFSNYLSSATYQYSIDGGVTWLNLVVSASTQPFSLNFNNSGVYNVRVRASNSPCTIWSSVNSVITVNPANVAGTATLTSASLLCNGSNVTAVVSGYSAGASFQWQNSADGITFSNIGTATGTGLNTTPSVGTTYYRCRISAGTCADVFTNIISVTVNPDFTAIPTITPAVTTTCSNTPVALNGVVTPYIATATYQYSVNGGTTWSAFTPGSASFTINHTFTTAGVYNIMVRCWNTPCNIYTSTAPGATVTITSGSVAGTATATSATTICTGSNFSATLIGNTGSIQWQESPDLITWNNLTGANGNNLTVTTPSVGVHYYRASVTNGTCAANNSNVLTLTVNTTPTAATFSSSSATVCKGSSGTLALASVGTGTLTWESSIDGGTTWATAQNGGTTLSYNNIQTTTVYRLRNSSAPCSDVVTAIANYVTITVAAPANAGFITPTSSTVCSSALPTLTLSGSVGNIIGWQFSSDQINWSTLSGTAGVSSISALNTAGTSYYRAQVRDAGSICAAVNSNTVSVQVFTAPTALTLSGTVTACSPASGVITSAGSTAGTWYWEASTNGGSSWTTVATGGTTLNYNNLTATTQYRVRSSNGVCTDVNSNTITITVTPAPVSGTATLTSASVLCTGSPVLASLTGYTGTNIQWEESTDNITYTSISGATTANLTVASLSTVGVRYYRASVMNNGCGPVKSNVLTVTVKDNFTSASLSATSATTICSGGTVNFSATWNAYISGATYEYSTDAGTSWNTLSTAGSPTAFTLTFANNTSNFITRTVRVRATNSPCGAVTSNDITVTVNPGPSAVLSATVTSYCIGTNASVSATFTNTTSGTLYEYTTNGGASWTTVANQGALTAALGSILVTSNMQVQVRLTNAGCNSSLSNTINITAVASPSIVLTGATTICAGNSTLLNVSTTNANAGSLIELSADNGATWTPISVTGSTISVMPATTANYKARITNSPCGTYTMPTPVTVTVNPVPVAGSVTPSATTVCSNGSAPLLTLGGYSGTIIRWESSLNQTTWTPIANTLNTYTPSIATAGDVWYRAVVNDANGVCTAVASAMAKVTSQLAPTAATFASTSATVCQGSNGTITLSNVGTGTITWEASTNAGANWTVVQNGGSNYAYTNIQNTTVYRIRNSNGVCADVLTASGSYVTITVTPAPVAGTATLTSAGTICSGSNATATLTGYTSGGTILWYSSTDGGATWNSTAQTTDALSIAATNTGTTPIILYRAMVMNGSCGPVYSNVITQNVSQNFTALTFVAGTATTICSGGTVSFTAGITPFIAGATYEYTINNGTTWTSFAPNGPSYVITLPFNSAGSYTVFARAKNGVCGTISTSASAISVTVNPGSVGGTATLTTASTICSGSSVNISLTGQTGTIQWQSSTNGVTYSDISSAIASTLAQTPFVATNTTMYYRAKVTNAPCSDAYSNVVMVTVKADFIGVPTLTPATSTICSGSSVTFTATWNGYIAGALYEYSQDGGSSWAPLSVSGSVTNFSVTFFNTSSSSTSKNVLVRSTNSPCNIYTSGAVTVNINPGPGVTISASATNVCSGQNANISASYSNVSASTLFEYSTNNGSTWTSASSQANLSSILGALAISNTNLQVQVRVTNAGCPAAYSNVITIVAIPVPTVSISGTATICYGSSTVITASYTNLTSSSVIELSANGGTTWTTVSGAVFTVTPSTTSTYQIRVTNSPCASVTSNLITVTVSTNPVAGTATVNTPTVCSSSTMPLISLTGYVGNIINWEISPDQLTWSSLGVTSSSISATNINGDRWYRAVVQDLLSACSPVRSNMVKVTVIPQPTAALTGTATICAGQSTVLNASYTNTTNSSVYEISNDGGNTWSTLTGTSITVSPSVTTTYNVRVTNAPCSPAVSSAITVTVRPVPTSTLSSNVGTVCNGSQANLIMSFGNTVTGTTTYTINDGSSNIYGPSNTPPSSPYPVTPTGPSTTYTLTVTTAPCANTVKNVTINVDPNTVAGTLNVNGSGTPNAIACSGSNSGSIVLTGAVGNVLQWEYSTDGGVTWNTINNTTTTQNYSNLSGTTQYRALVKSGVCNSAYTTTPAMITIIPQTVGGSVGSNGTGCSGSNSGTLNLTGQTGSVIRWEFDVNGSNSWTNTNAFGAGTLTPSGSNTSTSLSYSNLLAFGTQITYRFRAVVQNSSGSVTCNTANSAPATIVIDPATNPGVIGGTTTVCAGSSGSLSFTSAPVGNIIQWEYSTDGGVTWNTINNTTNTQNYSGISTTTMYRALVKSGVCSSAYTNTQTITVIQSPSVTLTGSATICQGTTTTIGTSFNNVTASTLYELQINGGTFTNLGTGSTGQSALIAALTNITPSSTTSYKVRVTNSPCTSVLSNTITITVDPTTVPGTLSANNTQCAPASGTLSISSSVGTVQQWEYSVDGGSTWTVSASSSTTYNYSGITTTTKYRALIKSGSCSPAYTNVITITVILSPSVTLSGTATICQGSTTTITASFGNADNSTGYEMQVNGTGFSNMGTGATGQAALVSALTNISPSSTSTYQVRVTNAGCSPVVSNSITITVNTSSVGGTINPATSTVCATSNSGTLTLTGSNGSVLQWEYTTDGGLTWNVISSTSVTRPFNNLTTTTQYRALVKNGVCNSQYSAIATVNVDPASVGGSLGGSTTICGGTNSGNLTLTGQVGSILRWESSTNNGVNWTTIANTTNSYAYSNIAVTTWFRVVVQSGSCSQTTSSVAIITIAPNPVANFTNTTVCFGNATVFNNTSSIASPGAITSYSWNFGDGNTSVAQNPTNNYAAAGTYNVTLVVTSNNGCTASVTKAVTVNAVPTASFTNTTECLGAATTFTNTSSITGSGNFIVAASWNFGDGNTSNSLATTFTKTYTSPGTYNVSLTVTTNFGCTSTFNKSVTVNPLPQVNFTFTNQCLGTAIAFNNTSTISSGSITNYAWNFGNGNTSNAVSPLYSYPLAGTYQVTLVATTNNGCKDSVSKSVTVYPIPVAGFTNSTVCVGSPTSFTNSSNVSGGTITNYSWSFGDGGSSTLQNPNYTYAGAGSYNVTLTVTSNNGCVNTITKSVTVNPRATVNFTAANVCFGNAVSFTNNSTLSSGTFSTAWNFGDGSGTSILPNPTYTYANPGTYKVTLYITTNNGCTDSLSKNVTVYANPVVKFTAANACQFNAVQFNNQTSISSGNTINQYFWKFGDGGTSAASDPTHAYALPGTYTVKLIAVTINGCSDSTTRTIVINPAPVANFTSNTTCLNDQAVFTNTSTVYTGNITGYLWNFGDNTTATTQNAVHKYTTAGTYNVSLTVTSDSGCTNTILKPIIIAPMPVANFNVDNVCNGDTMVFINASSIASGTLTYKWYFGDGDSALTTEAKHKYAADGTYNVTLVATSAYGCIDVKTRSVKVYPKPTPNFTAASVCLGNATVFNNTSTVSSGTVSLANWDFGDGTSSSVFNPTHTYATAGTFNVTMTVFTDKGCSNVITKSVTVYSLPASKITVTGTPTFCPGSNATLQVTNVAGNTYAWTRDNINTGTNTNTLTVTQGGLYKVRVTNANGCITEDSIRITVFPQAIVNAGPDVTISKGYSTKLNATLSINGTLIPYPTGNVTYSWSPGTGLSDTTIPNPMATPTVTTRYILKVKDMNDCYAYDTIMVTVKEDFKVDETNIITPNGDGYNDTWFIENIGAYTNAQVTIVNRWGQIVFETTAYDNANGWDGTYYKGGGEVPDGAYFYVITIPVPGNEPKVYRGAINVLRKQN